MSYSEVSICNIAINRIGGEIIRSFTEDNKQARVCSVAYPFCRDSLTSMAFWSFARRVQTLALLSTTPVYYNYAYQLPADCFKPFFIGKRVGRINWQIYGRELHTNVPSPCNLAYVTQVTDPAQFNQYFIRGLAAYIAAQIAPAIVQDKAVSKDTKEEATSVIRAVIEEDAGIGNDYRDSQEQPENDTFVNPDIIYSDYGELEWPYTD